MVAGEGWKDKAVKRARLGAAWANTPGDCSQWWGGPNNSTCLILNLNSFAFLYRILSHWRPSSSVKSVYRHRPHRNGLCLCRWKEECDTEVDRTPCLRSEEGIPQMNH